MRMPSGNHRGDLVLGGDKRFSDYGEHSVKGFDQRWHLFALDE